MKIKYKKIILVVTLILVVFAVTGVVSAAENVTSDLVSVEETTNDVVSIENEDIILNSSSENDFLSANSDGTFTDLANEIVNANGELNLTKNYIYDSSVDVSHYKNGIAINKNIIINGKGFIIDGSDAARVFKVSADNVILRNIDFINGANTDSGGVIYWNGVNGSIFDCNFIDCNSFNSASFSSNYYFGYGGAIYWNGDNGDIHDCTFTNCFSSGNGGAIYWKGNNGNLHDCSFTNCSSSMNTSSSSSSNAYGATGYSYGGAISWHGTNGNLFNCIFIDCKSSNSRSLEYSKQGTNIVSHTSSYSFGGAVYWNGDKGNLFNCDFIDCYSYSYSYNHAHNEYNSQQIYDPVSIRYTYSYCGAYWNGNDGHIVNCSFINPISSFIYSSGTSSQYSQSRAICTSSSSSSSSFGGAIYWNGDEGSLYDCDFMNSNSSSSYDLGYLYSLSSNLGSTVYWQGNNGGMYNCSIINSTSENKKLIYWNGTDGNLFNCSFNEDYYDYEKFCGRAETTTINPVILIHSSALNNDARIVIFECTQLVNNISVILYDVTDRKVLYDEFNISSDDLTSSLNLNTLNEGEYQIFLQYGGDNFYTSTSTNTLFKIGKNSSYEIKITENLVEGNNGTINLTLNNDATGSVRFTSSYYTCIKELVDGKTSFNLSYVHGGINDYQIKYVGDSKYNPIYINKFFNVLFKSDMTLNLKDNYIFAEDITLNYTITPNCTGIISIFVDNEFKANISVGDVFKLDKFNVGKYNITVIYNGDENFLSCSNASILTISKADPSIEVNSSNLPGDISFMISLNETTTGNVILILNDINSYLGNLTNGKTNIIVPNLNAGDYSVKIIYNGCKNYNNKTYTTTLTIDKMPTTVTGTVDDIIYTENAIINVKGSVDGIAIVKIDETYIKNINVIANTITPVTFENISAGKHDVTVTLKPTNTNYNESKYSTDFTVSKKETTVNLNVVDSVYGEDVIVNVTASEDGKVILKVGSIIREKNVLANTLTKVNFGVLAASSYDVEVSFDAGENYKPSTKNDNIVISPAKAEILILQAENNIYGENTLIKVKTSVEGTLTFNVGSITQSFDIVANKLTLFNFGILDAKTYAVEVSLDAGNNYTKPIDTTQVTIESKQTTVNVDVKNSTYGEKVIVNVAASENGEIIVNIGNTTKYVNVEADKVCPVDFSVLNANSYNVYVTFDGGNNYKKSYNNAFFIVSPAKSEITEIQTQDNTYGENTLIKVKTNVEGVLTAKINTITKKVNLNANQLTSIDFGILDANNYEVELSFNAGNNYIPTTATKTFKVLKTDPTISIAVTNATYGQKASIVVNSNAEGNATIDIGVVKTYNNVLFKNNKIVQDVIDIDAGSYSVKVTYNGNNNYNAKTYDAKLIINRAPTTTVATVDDIIYTENAIINVKGSVDGIAIVKIDETNIKNNDVMANTVTPISFENIPTGKHDVTITLKPTNANYDESIFNTDFTVSKKDVSVSLTVVDSIYGDDVIVNVTAGEDGKVVLKVGDITREKNVLANTPTKFNLGVLAVSSYNVEVSFDAGENYNVVNKQSTFTVTPAKSEITSIHAQNNIYGENTIINVKTNISGVLTVKINNNEKTFNIDANKLTSLDLDKYDAGTYNIDLSFDAGINYTKSTSTTKVTIVPKQTTTNVNADNSVYDNNVIVKVTASENGKVTVQIGNIVKSVNVDANKVTSVDFGILDVNSYEVSATFDGGKNFNTSSDKDSFEISPKNTAVTLNVKDYNSDEKVIVNVTASGNGKVNLKLNNIVKSVDVMANKLSSVDFGVLSTGSYDVVATFDAGSNYISSNDSANIKVLSKIEDKDIDITVPEIKPNQENDIVINLPADATGTVTLTIGNNSYTFTVKNGVADIKVPELSDGNYDYKINYSGDNKYSSFEKTDSITVAKPTPEIIVPPLDEPSADGSVAINLPGDATGTVTLVINGKAYSFPVVNGVANVYMPELKAGNYSYSITYSGDGKYSTFTNVGSMKVALIPVTISAPDVSTVYNSGKYIIATLKDNDNNPVSGLDVAIYIDGKTSNITTNDNGQAKLSANGLKPGIHLVIFEFNGNSKYDSSFEKNSVTVKKATPKITAAKKTFKRTLKTKKYTITLKNNQNKVMKNTKVYIKVNGKTYNAKTNSKGQATFKITKLTKKGKFNAVVTYKGNTYYKKVTKKVQITIK